MLKTKKIPLVEWLGMMGKTRHLTKAENKHLVEAAEMEIQRRWTRLKAMNDSPVL